LVKLTAITGSASELKLVDKIKDSESAIKGYSKFLQDHMKVHYEHFVRSSKNKAATAPEAIAYAGFNLLDLLYYHVYGDYRMVYRDNKLQLKYITLDPSAVGTKGASFKEKNVNDGILHRLHKDGIVGVYRPGSSEKDAHPAYGVAKISWMDDEINKGSSGFRLMLPSIGTQIINTFAFGNINTLFKKFVISMMKNLNSFIYSRIDDLEMHGEELSAGETDYVLTYLLNALKTDPDFIELNTGEPDYQYGIGNVESSIKDAFKEVTAESAIRVFADKYIQDAGPKFTIGEVVYLKDITKLDITLRGEMNTAIGGSKTVLNTMSLL
jgi:hypothetical protein